MTTKSKKNEHTSEKKDSEIPKLGFDAYKDLLTNTPNYDVKITTDASYLPDDIPTTDRFLKISLDPRFNMPKYLTMPERLNVGSDFLTGVEIASPFTEISRKIDTELSNIHEPISEHEKKIQDLELAIFDLQQNDEEKDIKIRDLTEKLESKKRKSKTKKRKSKSNGFAKLSTKMEKAEKIISTYLPDWRFTKDAHKEEAKDTSKE